MTREEAEEHESEIDSLDSPAPERWFHVVVRNDRTDRDTYCTRYPVTHHEGCVIMSKIDVKRPWLRKMLLPVKP